MKISTITVILIMLQSSISFCQEDQDIYYLNITQFIEEIALTDPNFSIKEIVDNSEIKGYYGFIRPLFSDTYSKVAFRNGLEKHMFTYINHRYYDNPFGIPIKMEVISLEINENGLILFNTGRVSVHVRFYYDNEIVTSYQQEVSHKTFLRGVTIKNIEVLDEMLNESLILLSRELDLKGFSNK